MSSYKDVVEFIGEVGGKLIGSRAWGGVRAGSDVDFIVSITAYNKIMDKVKKENLNYKIIFNSHYDEHLLGNTDNVKIYFNDRPEINLLSYNDKIFPEVVECAKIMRFASKQPKISDLLKLKPYRIRLFETLIEINLEIDIVKPLKVEPI